MTKKPKPGEAEDEVGTPISSPRRLKEALGERTELDNAADQVVGALNAAGVKTGDAMSFWEGIQRIKNTPVLDVVNDCTTSMTQMGRGDFFQREGIDLTNVEERLKRKYGEEQYERIAYSFKQWLRHVVFFIKINDQEQLPDAIRHVRELLAEDN